MGDSSVCNFDVGLSDFFGGTQSFIEYHECYCFDSINAQLKKQPYPYKTQSINQSVNDPI